MHGLPADALALCMVLAFPWRLTPPSLRERSMLGSSGSRTINHSYPLTWPSLHLTCFSSTKRICSIRITTHVGSWSGRKFATVGWHGVEVCSGDLCLSSVWRCRYGIWIGSWCRWRWWSGGERFVWRTKVVDTGGPVSIFDLALKSRIKLNYKLPLEPVPAPDINLEHLLHNTEEKIFAISRAFILLRTQHVISWPHPVTNLKRGTWMLWLDHSLTAKD